MKKRSGVVTFFIVLAGGIIGAIVGHLLNDTIPILDRGLKIGTDQLSLNLYLIDVKFQYPCKYNAVRSNRDFNSIFNSRSWKKKKTITIGK